MMMRTYRYLDFAVIFDRKLKFTAKSCNTKQFSY